MPTTLGWLDRNPNNVMPDERKAALGGVSLIGIIQNTPTTAKTVAVRWMTGAE